MHKQFVVIGLGRFGTSVARTLSSLGHDVLAIDMKENAVQAIMNEVTHAVQADAREEENLRALGVRNFDVAVVAIGDDLQANILITLMLKEMGIEYVVAKAQTNLHGRVLEKVGADKIIYPEKDMGVRVAHNLVTANIMDFIELSPDYSIVEILTPYKFIGKSLGELNLRAKYGISVMAIKNGKKVEVAPGADARIQERDILVVVSSNKAIEKLPE
ncbi:potassium channel family protein [Desulfitobacterium metallireducens]|uniref:Potassium transporter Trk n=1 Tax=Desulfitobacterium metallireducens DSM 15288 TaxID=871968 RepID=W0EBB1_9FIRM|nr:TrkA family potassium uptake protein [Desulfitobacterium metallireducens]AHF06341.1 potassium transporter Trk [Desulfitobacterium metallireducens DSM 15288]